MIGTAIAMLHSAKKINVFKIAILETLIIAMKELLNQGALVKLITGKKDVYLSAITLKLKEYVKENGKATVAATKLLIVKVSMSLNNEANILYNFLEYIDDLYLFLNLFI